MIGDRLAIYNPVTNKFFKRWSNGYGPLITRSPRAIWTAEADKAMYSTSLRCLQQYVAMLGDGCRIISETRAAQLDAIRRYREEADRFV